MTFFAPAERNVWFDVGREVYKHLATLEPEHRLVAVLLRCVSVVNNAKQTVTTQRKWKLELSLPGQAPFQHSH